MIYEIIRESDNKSWCLENPAFVRLSSDSVFCLTNEANAHAVYIEGICYHIAGREEIPGLDNVLLGTTGEEKMYSNEEVKEKLDSMNTTIDDILVALVETEV